MKAMDLARLMTFSNTCLNSTSMVKRWDDCKMPGPLHLNVVGLGRVKISVVPNCGGRGLLQRTPSSDDSCWLPDTLETCIDGCAELPVDDESWQRLKNSWGQKSHLDLGAAHDPEPPFKVIRCHAGPRSVLVDAWPDCTASTLTAKLEPRPKKRRRCSSLPTPTGKLQRKRPAPGRTSFDPLLWAERKTKSARSTCAEGCCQPTLALQAPEPKFSGSPCSFARGGHCFLLEVSKSAADQLQNSCQHDAGLQDVFCKIAETKKDDDSTVFSDMCKDKDPNMLPTSKPACSTLHCRPIQGESGFRKDSR